MIHFILPIYNECDNLPTLIDGLRRTMAGRDYRIIAVNDGSTDGSLDILKNLAAPDLLVTGSLINMNVGAVFSTGIITALKSAGDDDSIVIMEGDQTSDICLVNDLIGPIARRTADIVVASRYLEGGGYAGFPLPRKILSLGANRLIRHFFPVQRVLDYTIFFRAYRAGLLRQAVDYFGPFGLIQSKGFVANAELLIKLSLLTDKIAEIPFLYNYGKKKGASKINIFKTISEYGGLVSYLNQVMEKHHRAKG